MRLYNIYFLCKQYKTEVDDLNIIETRKNQIYVIEKWSSYKNTLSVLRNVKPLKKHIDDFYRSVPVFVREEQKPEIDSSIRNSLINKKKNIVSKMDAIIELYESMELGERTNGIDVKIPKCDSLDEYISLLKEIDFIFTQCPYMCHKDGQIKFNTVDVGSQWLSFLICAAAGSAAIKFIWDNLAAMIDVCLQLKSHLLSIKQQEEVLRIQKFQGDALKSSLDAFEVIKKHYISEAAKEIEEKNGEYPLKDGEERGKLEKSLEKLCGLLDKGVEIYASIDAPKEAQLLFPALGDKAELPDAVLKYLEEKNEA